MGPHSANTGIGPAAALVEEQEVLSRMMHEELRYWHAQHERKRDEQIAKEKYSSKVWLPPPKTSTIPHHAIPCLTMN